MLSNLFGLSQTQIKETLCCFNNFATCLPLDPAPQTVSGLDWL